MRILVIIFFFVLCTSCDPLRHIQFNNKTDSELQVDLIKKAYLNGDSADWPSNGSYSMVIPSQESRTILFTIGSWDNKLIKSFSKELDSVIIKNKDFTKIYTNQEDIYRLFKKNKGGFLNSHAINITIKDK